MRRATWRLATMLANANLRFGFLFEGEIRNWLSNQTIQTLPVHFPRGGGGGGEGVLTPNFGRYVPRQSEQLARAPERAPGRVWKCGAPERAWSVFSVKMRISGTAANTALPWEAMNGLKLEKFWKWWSPERQNPPKSVKWWCSGTDFFGNLWKWYAPEFRAELVYTQLLPTYENLCIICLLTWLSHQVCCPPTSTPATYRAHTCK